MEADMADPIVVGVDATAESRGALTKAADLAEKVGASVIAVHVRNEPSFAAIGEVAVDAVAIERTLDEVEASTRDHVSTVMAGRRLGWHLEVTMGDPAVELIRIAVEHRAGAIVVGGRGHGVVGGLVLGSVAQKLVRKSPVTVLVMRDGRTHRVKDSPDLRAVPAGPRP